MINFTGNVIELAEQEAKRLLESNEKLGQFNVGKGLIYVATDPELLIAASSFTVEGRVFYLSMWKK